MARLHEVLTARGYGAQSELARYLCGDEQAGHNQITRWVSAFSRWFRRASMPSLEDALTIDEWLRLPRNRRKKGDGK